MLLFLVTAMAGSYYLAETVARALVALGGQYLLGVDVRSDAVQFDGASWLLPGSPSAHLHITGLQIANPFGFESAQFMRVSTATVVFDRTSLGSSVVTIRRIALEDVTLHVERDSLTSNAGIILNQIARVAAAPRRFWEPELRVRVSRIEFRNLSARVAYAPSLGERGYTSIPVRELRYDDMADAGRRPAALISSLISRPVVMALREAHARK